MYSALWSQNTVTTVYIWSNIPNVWVYICYLHTFVLFQDFLCSKCVIESEVTAALTAALYASFFQKLPDIGIKFLYCCLSL